MECHWKWNVIKNGMSLKMECHSNVMSLKWKVTQNGMSLKIEFSLKMECSKCDETQKIKL